MGRRDEFGLGAPPPPELAHQFEPSEDFEFSVVSTKPAGLQPEGPRLRHGVYDNLGEANLHIAKLRVSSGGIQPNLKVITQPRGTAYQDLMDGRIKMMEGAAWPRPPRGRKK